MHVPQQVRTKCHRKVTNSKIHLFCIVNVKSGVCYDPREDLFISCVIKFDELNEIVGTHPSKNIESDMIQCE